MLKGASRGFVAMMHHGGRFVPRMPTRGETSDAVYCRHVVIGVVRLCLGKLCWLTMLILAYVNTKSSRAHRRLLLGTEVHVCILLVEEGFAFEEFLLIIRFPCRHNWLLHSQKPRPEAVEFLPPTRMLSSHCESSNRGSILAMHVGFSFDMS